MPTLFSETIGTKQKSSLFKYFEIMNKFLLIDSQWIAQLASIRCPELSLEKHLESEGSSNSKRSTLEDWLEKKVEAQWVGMISEEFILHWIVNTNGNQQLDGKKALKERFTLNFQILYLAYNLDGWSRYQLLKTFGRGQKTLHH